MLRGSRRHIRPIKNHEGLLLFGSVRSYSSLVGSLSAPRSSSLGGTLGSPYSLGVGSEAKLDLLSGLTKSTEHPRVDLDFKVTKVMTRMSYTVCFGLKATSVGPLEVQDC